MKKPKVIIVDDEYNITDVVATSLQPDYEVACFNSGESLLEHLKNNSCDIVLLDIGLPGISGIEVLKIVKSKYPDIAVIMLTASDTAKTAIEALKLGASEYITKPFDLDEFLLSVKKVIEEKRLREQNISLQQALETAYRFQNIIGDSDVMKKVYQKIHQAAVSSADVLILGETGTGKELATRAIHFNSPRKEGPFKAVNCSALPETLIESELFGHEKGAFTNAVQTRKGAIELADGGTLFLDEIGDLKPELQVKLLRVLEQRKFSRVGGDKEIEVNIRLICATNKDLKKLVNNGKIRQDLYYRINTFPIVLPPLRKRKDDIPLLIQHFLKQFRQNYGEHSFSPGTIDVLTSYNWPGNIRELKNVMERTLASLHGSRPYTVYSDHIPEEIKVKISAPVPDIPILDLNKGTDIKKVLAQFEAKIIREALVKSNGNITRAAQLLKTSYRMLKYRMDKLGVK